MSAFIPAAIIALQLFIIGPAFMVISNNERSAISLADLLGWPLVMAIVTTVIVGIALRLLRNAWKGRLLALAWVFAGYLLIQFFWFIPSFGVLDGRQIDFGSYWVTGSFEAAVAIALLSAALIRPFWVNQTLSGIIVILLLVFVGQTGWQAINSRQTPSGERVTASSSDFFKDDEVHDVLSLGERNAIVVLVDTMQGDVFEKVVNSSAELKEKFRGFTLFNNATGHFPYTGLSVPALLSGTVYAGGDETIPSYLAKAGKRRLEAVFESNSLRWGRVPLKSRAEFLDGSDPRCRAVGTVYDASLFRQLPLILKGGFYAKGEMQIAKRCGMIAVPSNTSELDLAVLNSLSTKTVKDSRTPKMVYVHLWGLHPPANLSSGCEVLEPSVEIDRHIDQAVCILGRVGDYLDRLREIGAFENSAIFVVADHGTRYGFLEGDAGPIPNNLMSSANPTIAYHAPTQTGPMAISASPVSLIDVYPTIASAFQLPVEAQGRRIASIVEGETRQREFLFYKKATDVYGDYIPQFEKFAISGHVRDPIAWRSLGVESELEYPLTFVDFGSPDAYVHLNYGWSAEAAGVPFSWLIANPSNPATVSGVLPAGKHIKVRVRMMNPHFNQVLTFKLGDREVGRIVDPVPTGWTERDFTFETADQFGLLSTIKVEASQTGTLSSRDPRKLAVALDWIRFDGSDD